MTNNPNHLGGQAHLPIADVVLGGLEGVKSRLANGVMEQQVAAISEALNYGDAGRDLIVQSFKNRLGPVMWAAYSLLQQRTEVSVKQMLWRYHPYRLVECLHTLGGHSREVNSVAISPNGQTVVSGSSDFRIKVWNLKTGCEIYTLTGHSGLVRSVAITPDGQTVISGSHDKTIRLWNINTGQEIGTLKGHSDCVDYIAITSDGQTVISSSHDHTIRLWNINTKKIGIFNKDSGCVLAVGSSADGQILVTGYGRALMVWKLETGQLLCTLYGHTDDIASAAISPDGQILVSGSDDSTVRLWDLNAREEIYCIEKHGDYVKSVAFSPDGQTFASGSWDMKIKVWDLNRIEEICTLSGHTDPVTSIAFSPNGQIIVSGSDNNIIKIWGVK